jgi:hypothetical protein
MTRSFQSAFERHADAVCQHLEAMPLATETQLGSWFQSWKDSGTGGLVQTIVKTDIRLNVQVESWLARAMYWLAVVLGLAISGFVIWLFVHDGFARDDLLAAPLVLAAALLLYGAGWGWRWFWTGRTDHLFSGKKYTPRGRLDELRKNVASLVALLNF